MRNGFFVLARFLLPLQADFLLAMKGMLGLGLLASLTMAISACLVCKCARTLRGARALRRARLLRGVRALRSARILRGVRAVRSARTLWGVRALRGARAVRRSARMEDVVDIIIYRFSIEQVDHHLPTG
jgi:hypothetical protein